MELETSNNDNKEVNDVLCQWEICWRCRLRITDKIIDFQKFNSKEELTENWLCYLCSGILQNGLTSDNIIDQLKFDISNAEFKFLSFQIVVSTPINLFIREFALFLILKEKFPLKYESLSRDEIIPIKSVWRYLMKDRLSIAIGKDYMNGLQVQSARSSKDCLLENDFLIVNVSFTHCKSELECSVLMELEPESFKRRRKGESRYKWDLFTKKSLEQVLKNVNKEKLQRCFSVPPNHVRYGASERLISLGVDVTRQDYPVMVAGRYCKLSRRLPQSPWIFDGVRKLESSVEELIAEQLVSAFRSESHGFISSGREDVDVRMLGSGRPFVMELRNCRNLVRDVIERMGTLEQQINRSGQDRISVNGLRIISKEFVSLIKQGEQEKCKQYRMVVWCENGGITAGGVGGVGAAGGVGAVGSQSALLQLINGTRDLLVQQLTPIRVLHRRALIDRPRTFYSFSASPLDQALSADRIRSDPTLNDYSRFLSQYEPDNLFLLHLRCQAGSYVKEFVHGDLGRTRPNLATIIGQQCDILALDVMEIELEWPPK